MHLGGGFVVAVRFVLEVAGEIVGSSESSSTSSSSSS